MTEYECSHTNVKTEMKSDSLKWFTRKGASRSGVYMLLWNKKVQYVGQSADVDARVAEHRRAGVIRFNGVKTAELPLDRLKETEERLIRKYKPPFNVAHTGRSRLDFDEIYYQKTFRLQTLVISQMQEMAYAEKRSVNQWLNLAISRLHDDFKRREFADRERVQEVMAQTIRKIAAQQQNTPQPAS